jgi:glycosyltransferase involved in cell wall biosynthesis
VKVAFDVTPLGAGRFYPRSRTGIFRVCAELLTALHATAELSLLPSAVRCRGEAEDEVRRLGLPLRVNRSDWDRALYPAITRLFVPEGLSLSEPLSERRRKALRTCVQAVESVGGHPRALGQSVDICHSPYLPPSELGWRATQRAARIVTVHDVLPLTHRQFFPGGDDQQLERVLEDIRLGAVAHCVSKYTQSELIRLLPEARERSFVSELAASPRLFSPPKPEETTSVLGSLGLSGDYLLCLGTLDARKNLVTCLAAAEVVLAQRRGIKLVIVGAPARNALAWEQLFTRFPKARSACVFTGYLPDTSLPVLYAGATAVLFASFAEGFGLPALEAMQCGAALISSNATSLPEVVGDGGLLLDPNDTEAWGREILRLMDEPEARRELIEQGLRRSQHFSWAATAAGICQVYRQLKPA